MVVVPSASKMMRELFGKVPCVEELALVPCEPLEERHRCKLHTYSLWGGDPCLYCRKIARYIFLKPPSWTSGSPAFLEVWLFAS